MPYRIAIGSCSHPSLEQPLWQIIRSREPAAFIWGGDAIYSDHFVGLNWTAVGIHRVVHGEGETNTLRNTNSSWTFTFPPPSIHVDATPDMIRYWYEQQWAIDDYRHFVEGWNSSDSNDSLTRPIIFGVIDDHDYGQNNGDSTYQYKKESNVAFVDFLYSGSEQEDGRSCTKEEDVDGEQGTCESREEQSTDERRDGRRKSNDPMYQRALMGKGVYGVQLFDFSQRAPDAQSLQKDHVLWGGGYWVPDEDARIDPDIIGDTNDELSKYSSTHSVAIFALDVRTNKTPWPKRKQKHNPNDSIPLSNSSASNTPAFDFLGQDQWDWFKSALNNSRAAVNIIVSGLQIHPERFPNDGNIIEEWSKFPEARQMLYDTILNSGVRSPLLVSGDVHMAQILRKDCVKASDVISENATRTSSAKRPLIEITTSGMTHSWGTCFSSQPKNHRLPLKPYSYFVSRTFMTICHFICPWFDIVVRTLSDVNQETESKATIKDDDKSINEVRGGSLGKQYYLGLNFAEFEFNFDDQSHDNEKAIADGSVTVRIFGRQPKAPAKLELTYTFEELSGNVDLPGMTAKFPQDFSTVRDKRTNIHEDDWICVPHRGLASIYHEYAANIGMFLSFCFLFFLPHVSVVSLLVISYRKWSGRESRTKSRMSKPSTVHSNGTHQ
jgi:hypothetical protein